MCCSERSGESGSATSFPGFTPLPDDLPAPEVVDRETWRAARAELLAREKAHTHEGDAIAAARRRLPMVEVDANLPLTGPDGPVTLLETFEGRRLLVAYFHMWFAGESAPDQCEGCTYFNSQVRELSYLHERDVTYATFAKGSYAESVRYRDFMGWDVPWYGVEGEPLATLFAGREDDPMLLACYLRRGDRVFETYATTRRGLEPMAPTNGLLDLTVYGRQETWQDVPDGWPQPWPTGDGQWRTGPRPTSQWSRVLAGRSDDLTGRGLGG